MIDILLDSWELFASSKGLVHFDTNSTNPSQKAQRGKVPFSTWSNFHNFAMMPCLHFRWQVIFDTPPKTNMEGPKMMIFKKGGSF